MEFYLQVIITLLIIAIAYGYHLVTSIMHILISVIGTMFYTWNDAQVDVLERSATMGFKVWRMVELPKDGSCYIVTVQSSCENKEERLVLFSELSDFLAYSLVVGHQRIAEICLINRPNGTPEMHFGSINEIWITEDLPVAMRFDMKDGTVWSHGLLPDEPNAVDRLKLIFRLANSRLVSVDDEGT